MNAIACGKKRGKLKRENARSCRVEVTTKNLRTTGGKKTGKQLQLRQQQQQQDDVRKSHRLKHQLHDNLGVCAVIFRRCEVVHTFPY